MDVACGNCVCVLAVHQCVHGYDLVKVIISVES